MRKQITSYEELKNLNKGRSVMVCFVDTKEMPPPLCPPDQRPIIDSIFYNAGEVLLEKTGLPKITENEWPKYYIQEDNEGFFHKEAYCVMRYCCKACNRIEIIWNSRDGVTPFAVPCKTCSKEAVHENWNLDERVVDYKPLPRSRVFIDTPKEIHDFLLRSRINRQWENGFSYPMKDHFLSKRDAFLALGKEYDPSKPYLLTLP
jgi:hypothetical protein